MTEGFITDPSCRKASWIGNLVIFLQGRCEVVYYYTASLLVNEGITFAGADKTFRGQEFKSILGIAIELATVLVAILISSKFSHRKIMCIGHSLMFIFCALISLFYLIDFKIGILISTISYMLVFMSTTGPCSFAFVVEICTDIALGIAMS